MISIALLFWLSLASPVAPVGCDDPCEGVDAESLDECTNEAPVCAADGSMFYAD